MNWASLLFVLAMVESSGNPHVRDGDGGLAKGMYQIHKSYLTDVNYIFGNNYTHEQMKDRRTAELVVVKYLHYWGYRYEFNTGLKPTIEDYCRMHNGGCHFYKKRHKTDNYWNKCKNIIAKYNVKF
tara:strand:- start:85 stop:462 length:378 start_codon:yes stop_codon:yes gene_type:complete